MVQIINPIEHHNWDKLLLTNENHSFFHTSSWAKVISESYNYRPLYFTEIDKDKLTALIPIMEVKSPLTGKRGVAFPFTDFCPLISSNEHHFKALLGKIIGYGKKAKWKTIELRDGKEYLQNKNSSKTFLSHSLNLVRPEQKIFSRFRSSTKRNIKKAIKEGVKVEICDSLESVRDFYQLNCLTRKEHGLPPQPRHFFKNIFDHIISPQKGIVALASFQERPIAGAIYFHFEEEAIYKYGASDKNYHHLRPNNLVMWEAIKWYGKNGCKRFSFGRTDLDHEGLIQFKRGWGAQEETLHYYKYDLTKDEFVKNSLDIKLFNTFFRKLPIPLLKLIGRLLYPHVG
jgi:hypothetical protein